VPNKYYYQINKDWVLSRSEKIVSNRTYYTLDPDEVFTVIDVVYYIPNKYYYEDANGKKVLDVNSEITIGRTYYKKNGLYVIDDDLNIVAKGSEWNSLTKMIPAAIHLGSRTELYGFTKLQGFARTLNTIHGLILKIN
jgi:hypothetical protein